MSEAASAVLAREYEPDGAVVSCPYPGCSAKLPRLPLGAICPQCFRPVSWCARCRTSNRDFATFCRRCRGPAAMPDLRARDLPSSFFRSLSDSQFAKLLSGQFWVAPVAAGGYLWAIDRDGRVIRAACDRHSDPAEIGTSGRNSAEPPCSSIRCPWLLERGPDRIWSPVRPPGSVPSMRSAGA